ncbi:MAG: hypothetical protein H6974_01630 [Gammaproteobacteria bacterium]|nr:hypothetical protein [Gammaproteobacteria bacterium]MCP5195487.1 hypothetical protein [Gammaproteobacteria bacterium]
MASIKNDGNTLQRQYVVSMLLIGGLLLIALIAYAWFSIAELRADRRAAIIAQSEQLKIFLDDKINVARGHVFAMRRAIENTLHRSDLGDTTSSDQLLQGIGVKIDESEANTSVTIPSVEIGSLHISPSAKLDKTFRRDLAAATSFLPGAAADHQWHKMFQWSYYYDAGQRWFFVYPSLSTEALLNATRTSDLGAAIKAYFDADGTHPVEQVGPHNNPKRDMIWTRPYEDAGGKGMMVTLLAPIYLTDEYVGAVGTDVTLDTLDQVLHIHAPEAGRALIVDADGILLADQNKKSQVAREKVAFSSLFSSVQAVGDDWLNLPLVGTPWTLRVYLDNASLHQLLTNEIRLYLVFAVLLVMAILAIGLFQSHYYAGPALRLAAFFESFDGAAVKDVPTVPPMWTPIFARVAQITRDRRNLLEQIRRQAEELEIKVAERTVDLQQANDMLEQKITDLKKTQNDLVRADRLGALGSLIAGVAYRIQGSLDQVGQTTTEFLADIQSFKNQLARGLRKAELEAFMEQAEIRSQQVDQDIETMRNLLSRFRQMAVDRTSEQPRRFRLHEVAESVRAVIGAVSTCTSCEIDNDIPPTLEMDAAAGALGQLLHHLLMDAIERAERNAVSAQIALSARLGNDERGEWILLTLSDRAPPATEPGASLVLAQTLVQYSFEGDLEITGTDEGARVTLRLPKGVD